MSNLLKIKKLHHNSGSGYGSGYGSGSGYGYGYGDGSGYGSMKSAGAEVLEE